jgi:hypothetical protein
MAQLPSTFATSGLSRFGHTSRQIIFYLNVLLSRHTEQGGDAVSIGVPVRQALRHRVW